MHVVRSSACLLLLAACGSPTVPIVEPTHESLVQAVQDAPETALVLGRLGEEGCEAVNLRRLVFTPYRVEQGLLTTGTLELACPGRVGYLATVIAQDTLGAVDVGVAAMLLDTEFDSIAHEAPVRTLVAVDREGAARAIPLRDTEAHGMLATLEAEAAREVGRASGGLADVGAARAGLCDSSSTDDWANCLDQADLDRYFNFCGRVLGTATSAQRCWDGSSTVDCDACNCMSDAAACFEYVQASSDVIELCTASAYCTEPDLSCTEPGTGGCCWADESDEVRMERWARVRDSEEICRDLGIQAELDLEAYENGAAHAARVLSTINKANSLIVPFAKLAFGPAGAAWGTVSGIVLKGSSFLAGAMADSESTLEAFNRLIADPEWGAAGAQYYCFRYQADRYPANGYPLCSPNALGELGIPDVQMPDDSGEFQCARPVLRCSTPDAEVDGLLGTAEAQVGLSDAQQSDLDAACRADGRGPMVRVEPDRYLYQAPGEERIWEPLPFIAGPFFCCQDDVRVAVPFWEAEAEQVMRARMPRPFVCGYYRGADGGPGSVQNDVQIVGRDHPWAGWSNAGITFGACGFAPYHHGGTGPVDALYHLDRWDDYIGQCAPR